MSVYTVATNGLSVQARRFAQHADAIASFTPAPVKSAANGPPVDIVSVEGMTPVEDHLTGLSVAKTGYAANAKVINAQQEMDRSLLDIIT